jgi:hypothetical protein
MPFDVVKVPLGISSIMPASKSFLIAVLLNFAGAI